MKMSDAAPKKPVTFITNWRIGISQGRAYGVCSVEAPEEFKDHSFRRGFPLTDPTHVRCAIFAIVLGMEQAICSERLRRDGCFAVIVTKSKQAADMVLAPTRSAFLRKWASEPRQKPLKVAGFSKKFVSDMYEMLDAMRSKGIGDVAYVQDEKEKGSLMEEHLVHLDIDPEKDYCGDTIGDPDETRASDTKQRNLLRQELAGLCVRGSKGAMKPTKSQRKQIAKNEGHGKLILEKKKEEQETKAKKTAPQNADPRNKPEPHSGLAAAIAAEELRVAAAAASNSGSGGNTAPGNGSGNVQEPEHGTRGGDGKTSQGAGEREAAALDSPEHLS